MYLVPETVQYTKLCVLFEELLTQELLAPLDYADSHAKVMSAIADLHIISYDIVFAKDGHVLLRYSAEGSHCGQPHNGIEPSGRKAQWTASAIFEVKEGKVHSFTKEWDKLNMWKQLGWVCALSSQNKIFLFEIFSDSTALVEIFVARP